MNYQKVHCPPPRPVPPKANWNPEHVGVTTSDTSIYERSCFDRIMAGEFNPEYVKHGNPSGHTYESFSFRTNFDKGMLNEFDSEYRNDKAVREAYQPSKSYNQILHDPYQPYSYYQTFPSIN